MLSLVSYCHSCPVNLFVFLHCWASKIWICLTPIGIYTLVASCLSLFFFLSNFFPLCLYCMCKRNKWFCNFLLYFVGRGKPKLIHCWEKYYFTSVYNNWVDDYVPPCCVLSKWISRVVGITFILYKIMVDVHFWCSCNNSAMSVIYLFW